MSRILDIILAALLAAAVVALVAVLALEPYIDSRVSAAVAVHAAEPLDVNDRIIVRWEYPDGTEALPPEVMPLWKYVWLPQSRLDGRINDFEQVSKYLLSDPVMRGHLVRHGVSETALDVMLYKLGE